jgi:hypothetical protein
VLKGAKGEGRGAKGADPAVEAAARIHALSILGLVLLPFVLQLTLVKFPDTDAFYHLKHAAVYLEKGPFYQEFPWHTQSLIGDLGADLWYGFHLSLVPFTLIGDPFFSLRVASAVMLAVLLLCFYGLCRRERMPLPWLWPVVLLGSSPVETWRWLALRPFLVSLTLVGFLFFACFGKAGSDGASPSRTGPLPSRLWVCLLSAALAWFHPALFWLAPFVVGVCFLVRGLVEKTWNGTMVPLSMVGIAAGLLLRPDALDALRLLQVQLLDLSRVVRTEPFFPEASEMRSLIAMNAVSPCLPFLFVWLGVLGFCAMASPVRKVQLDRRKLSAVFAAAAIGGVFAAMSFFGTLRAADPWVFFASLSMGLALGLALDRAPNEKAYKSKASPALLAFAGAALVGACVSFVESHKWINHSGFNVYRLGPAAEWLKRNSAPGDVVFHLRWSDFAELFYWNDRNRYITGMDPIFLYVHDRPKFWQYSCLEQGVCTDQVSSTPPSEAPTWSDTFTALKEGFGARYVVATPEFSPAFLGYLDGDKRYKRVFANKDAAVYELE